MRKITMTVAAFLATAAISAAEITNAGVTITVQKGLTSASADFSLPKGSYVINGGTNGSLTVAVSFDGGKEYTSLTDGEFTLDKDTTLTVKATVTGGTVATNDMTTTVNVSPDATKLEDLKNKYTKQLSGL